jgi:hypothetical protein
MEYITRLRVRANSSSVGVNSLFVTAEPVAAPPNWLARVAVNVTDWLMTGLMDEVTHSSNGGCSAHCLGKRRGRTRGEPPAPVYSAVIEFAPTGSDESTIEARPFVTGPLATTVEPSAMTPYKIQVHVPGLVFTRVRKRLFLRWALNEFSRRNLERESGLLRPLPFARSEAAPSEAGEQFSHADSSAGPRTRNCSTLLPKHETFLVTNSRLHTRNL